MKKFTLIELLVVVAIIGILLSLLLPNLVKAREIAKTAVCVSNISQINKALSMYLSKSNGKMPYHSDIRDRWPAFLDPYLGGPSFSGPTEESVTGQSTIWGDCPNSFNKPNPPFFRDSDYAGVFPNSSRWFKKSVAIITDPANSMIFTEGNHESASRGWLGNSWIKVGTGVDENEYNNITGISWSHVRHQNGKVFTTSFFDGSSKSIRWLTLNSFTSNYGLWVNEY